MTGRVCSRPCRTPRKRLAASMSDITCACRRAQTSWYTHQQPSPCLPPTRHATCTSSGSSTEKCSTAGKAWVLMAYRPVWVPLHSSPQHPAFVGRLHHHGICQACAQVLGCHDPSNLLRLGFGLPDEAEWLSCESRYLWCLPELPMYRQDSPNMHNSTPTFLNLVQQLLLSAGPSIQPCHTEQISHTHRNIYGDGIDAPTEPRGWRQARTA